MTDGNGSGSKTDRALSLGASLVHALLDRRQIPRHRRATVVSEILKLGYTQAHRRLVSGVPWMIDDVARIATHFGETFDSIVLQGLVANLDPLPSREPLAEDPKSAMFCIGELRLPCEVWLGDPVDPVHGSVLVAECVSNETEESWIIRSGQSERLGSDSIGLPMRQVRRLLVRLDQAPRHRVALIGLDDGSADALCDSLRKAGLAAQVVATGSAQDSVWTLAFDAFLIDWESSKVSDHALIAILRSRDAQCPIVLVAGAVATTLADEALISEAMQRWHVTFVERPIRGLIVATALQQALKSTKNTGSRRDGPRWRSSTASARL